MGTVLRLRADFDMTGYSPATQVILRALQDHGAVRHLRARVRA